MDWFERLTGFRELDYYGTRAKLKVQDGQLRSLVNGKSYGIGDLELVSLGALRERVRAARPQPGRLKVSIVTGDVRPMHQLPENAGALFQVASQFNLLEMTGSQVTPEDGVTRYQDDRTQGPACAIAAGAATIYRNYFAPVAGAFGQTAGRQIDGLAQLGAILATELKLPTDALWKMENGYALCSRKGLDAISEHLRASSPTELDDLRTKLCIGLHRDVEVTDTAGEFRPQISQAFCSALPVSYTRVPAVHWKAFALLVLQAAYEATMLAAILNAQRGVSNVVLLTQLGGNAFGNDDSWIDAATRRALEMSRGHELHVKLVSYGRPSQSLERLVADFG